LRLGSAERAVMRLIARTAVRSNSEPELVPFEIMTVSSEISAPLGRHFRSLLNVEGMSRNVTGMCKEGHLG